MPETRKDNNSLGLCYKVVSVIPVSKQLSFLRVVHSNITVFEHAGKEIVDLSGHVQYIANPTQYIQSFCTSLTLLLFIFKLRG